MPLEPREAKAGRSGSRPTASRRTLIRAGLGSGFLARYGMPTLSAMAQSDSATPVADPADSSGDGIVLPTGISIAGNGAPAPGSPVTEGMLRLVRPGVSLENFNPSAFAQDPQIPWSYLEPLVRPDPATLRPMPWLADRWEWRAGGLELVLSIRDDVVWHDGAALTAADAAFSLAVYHEDTDSAVSGLFGLVDAVEATDDRELVVRFSARDANWLFNVATLPIFSRRQYLDFWDGLPAGNRTLSGFDWSRSTPIGTGPWQIGDSESSRVGFTRFDGYWGSGPWFSDLEIAVEEGPRARLGAWVDGDSQIAWPVRLHEVREAGEALGTLYPAPAASVMFAAFNFANPMQPAGSLWADLRVRQAVSLAVNRERYAEEVFGGFIHWDAAGAISQPWAHDPELVTPGHNPEAASVLLAEAGWLDYDGDGVREDLNGWQLRPVAILREDSRPELAAVLARVARDLAGVGIGLAVEVLPVDEFDERWISRRDYDLIAYAYDQLPGFTDFDLYGSAWDIRTNPAGWNPGGYANAEADAAIDEFLNAVSIARQATALRRLQRAVNEDLFGLWLGFPDDLVLVAANIEGFEPDMAWQTARTWDVWRTTTSA